MDRQVSILNIILPCLPSGLLFRVLQDRCRGNIWTLLNTKAVNSHRCTVYIYYGDICAFALAFMLFKTLRRKKTLQKKHSENFSESERYLSKFRVRCFLLTLLTKYLKKYSFLAFSFILVSFHSLKFIYSWTTCKLFHISWPIVSY